MNTPTESISPSELAAYQAARARAQLAQAQAQIATKDLEIVTLRLFLGHGLTPADQIDDVTGAIRRAPKPEPEASPVSGETPNASEVKEETAS